MLSIIIDLVIWNWLIIIRQIIILVPKIKEETTKIVPQKKQLVQNNEINKIRKEARLNFTTELQKILADYSAQNSIDLIINQENILVGNKKLDISEDILKAVNEKKIKLTK